MPETYESEKDVYELVRSFEEATITREEWRHGEHLVVALYYLTRNDAETATAKMKAGIFNLLKAFGIDLENEMPYHETLTVFWMLTIAEFERSRAGASLYEKANELVTKYDKNYPLRFYSREHLFSEKARAGYVPGDLEAAAKNGATL